MSSYEDAISSTAGWGLYNTAIFTMCGFCFMAEGSLTAALSNVLPVSVAEVSPGPKALIGFLSMHTAGLALGNLLGGVALDATGRRCVVPLALMVAFTGTTVWTFAGNTEFIFIGMLFLGMGLGMHSLALRVYLIEMLPPSSRGSRTALLSIFWALGFFCASALQLLLEPLAETHPRGFRPASWRVVASFSACFTAIVACTCGALGPSTRWLLAQTRVSSAVEHVRRMYAINKSMHADTFQAPRLRGYITEFPPSWRVRDDTIICTYMVTRMGKQIGACFTAPRVTYTVLAVLIRLPILNGMWTDMPWMAPLLQYPCRIRPPLSHMDSLEEAGEGLKLKIAVFENTVILAAVVIIATTVLHFLIDIYSHRLMLCIFLGLTIGALTCELIDIPYIPNEAICCIIFGSLINSEIVFTVICAEIYPTHIRGTANGIIPVLGRLASIPLHIYLQRGECMVATYVLLAACGLSMVLVWALPERAKKPLLEEAVPGLLGRDSEVAAGAAAGAGAAAPARPGRAAAMRDDNELELDLEDVFDMEELRREGQRGAAPRHADAAAAAAPAGGSRPGPPRAALRAQPAARARRRTQHDKTPTRNYPEAFPREHIQEARRRIKAIKIVDSSHEVSSSGSRTTEPVELIIISEVPISSAKVISSKHAEYLPLREKVLANRNLICKCDLGTRTIAGITSVCSRKTAFRTAQKTTGRVLQGSGDRWASCYTNQKFVSATTKGFMNARHNARTSRVMKRRITKADRNMHLLRNRMLVGAPGECYPSDSESLERNYNSSS